MTNYKIELSPVDPTADVVEQKTGLTLYSKLPLNEARTLMRQLNGGRGFNGFTPEFFLGRLQITSPA